MASSIICILQLCGVVKVRIHLNSIGNNDFVWESGKPQNMMETYFFFVLLSFYFFFLLLLMDQRAFTVCYAIAALIHMCIRIRIRMYSIYAHYIVHAHSLQTHRLAPQKPQFHNYIRQAHLAQLVFD